MNIANYLGSGSYYQLNKILIKKLESVQETMYLTHLIDLREFLRAQKQIREDGSFFCTQKQVEELLFFSTYEQNKFVKDLVHRGLIRVTREGMPPKYHFYILDDAIHQLLTGEA